MPISRRINLPAPEDEIRSSLLNYTPSHSEILVVVDNGRPDLLSCLGFQTTAKTIAGVEIHEAAVGDGIILTLVGPVASAWPDEVAEYFRQTRHGLVYVSDVAVSDPAVLNSVLDRHVSSPCVAVYFEKKTDNVTLESVYDRLGMNPGSQYRRAFTFSDYDDPIGWVEGFDFLGDALTLKLRAEQRSVRQLLRESRRQFLEEEEAARIAEEAKQESARRYAELVAADQMFQQPLGLQHSVEVDEDGVDTDATDVDEYSSTSTGDSKSEDHH